MVSHFLLMVAHFLKLDAPFQPLELPAHGPDRPAQAHFPPHLLKALGLAVVVADHLHVEALPQPTGELVEECLALGQGNFLLRHPVGDGAEGFEGGEME
jgi:hypothetical protein